MLGFTRMLPPKLWKTSFRALVVAIWPWLTPYQEILMNKDQVKGKVEEVKGKVKEAAGVVMDDDELETEGNVEKNVGKVRKGFGDLKEELKKDR
jgi:uncharacterized protein YjbJ (UPF0337 family)